MGVVSSEGNRCNVSHQFALVLDLHGLYRNPSQLALTSTNHQIPIRQNPNGRYAETKQSLDWSHSLVDGFFDIDLEDVSGLGAAVDVRVVVVDGCVGELALDVAEVGVEGLDLLVDLVDGQDLDAVVLDCDEPAAVVIEEEDLVDGLLVGRAVEALAALHVPNHQHVLVLEAALRGEEAGVGREGEAVDGVLVQLEAVLDVPALEVPDEHLCDLPGEGALGAGDVPAVAGDLDGRDLVIMSPEEGLGAGEDVPNDHC